MPLDDVEGVCVGSIDKDVSICCVGCCDVDGAFG